MSASEVVLQVENINTFYGEAHILHDVHLKVLEGESVALLGRNGAGKTTTLRSILGLTPAKTGKVVFKSQEITHRPTNEIANLGIGWVPDNRRIFPTLTVQRNMEIARKRGSGNHPVWDLERVYSHFPKLKDLRQQKGENLSGGEQQMLSIARTLMGNPDLILLDEPSEGLAPLMIREVMNIISELSSMRIAIVLVEQNSILALRICSRAYVLDDGRNVYEGDAQSLMNDDGLKKQLLGIYPTGLGRKEVTSVVTASNRWRDVTASLGDATSFRVSWLIASFLAARGVDRIFGLCGGHIQPIWDDAGRLGIRIIDVRDERAAVHMAQAHSELTGEIGVAMVTAGPGMTNSVTGIANAHVSRVPVLVISGRPPRPQQNMGALQEIPQAEIVRPVTRYARTVCEATHVIRELDEALACALGLGGEKGPAYIDFPTDLLREELSAAFVERDRFEVRTPFPVLPAAEAVEYAAELLWSARRLLIVSGRGAAGAGPQIVGLLNALGCAYLDTAESRGIVPDDHPSFVPAMRGRAMQEADLVFTVGRCLDAQLGYGSSAVFPNARFLRIGVSASEVKRKSPGVVEIFGTVREVLAAIVETAGARPAATDRAWIEELREKDRKRREDLERELANAAPGRTAGCILTACSAASGRP